MGWREGRGKETCAEVAGWRGTRCGDGPHVQESDTRCCVLFACLLCTIRLQVAAVWRREPGARRVLLGAGVGRPCRGGGQRAPERGGAGRPALGVRGQAGGGRRRGGRQGTPAHPLSKVSGRLARWSRGRHKRASASRCIAERAAGGAPVLSIDENRAALKLAFDSRCSGMPVLVTCPSRAQAAPGPELGAVPLSAGAAAARHGLRRPARAAGVRGPGHRALPCALPRGGSGRPLAGARGLSRCSVLLLGKSS